MESKPGRPKTFKPKVKRDRTAEAIAHLRQEWRKEHPDEVWEADKEPAITPMLKAVEGGIPRVLEALRAYGDEDARAFIECSDGLTSTDARLISLECIAFASGIGSLRLAEIAQTAMYLYGSAQTKLLIASSMHKVTKSIVKAATDEVPIVIQGVKVGKTNGDVKAMELFGKMSGIVPIPKGAQIAIQNNFSEHEDRKSDEGSHQWRYPEDRLKEIVSVVNPKQLPSPASSPDEMIHFEQNRPTVFERR